MLDMSPKFDFFKRKTQDIFQGRREQADSVKTVTQQELLEIIDLEKKRHEKDLITSLQPTRESIMDCLDNLKQGANELDKQKIKIENPQFESLINTSKRILITSIKKESLVESSEIKGYEDAVKFKNNLELLVNRFGQVGDSHNRILNEFMAKHINKLKNEFDRLSSLLKEVTRILSVKESEMNKIIACRSDLISYKEKVDERKNKVEELSELMEEKRNIDKNIDESKRQYGDYQRSEDFLKTTDTLDKITDKKTELLAFEKSILDIVSNLSRAITKFSYVASKQTQAQLTVLQNKPLEILSDESEFTRLFWNLKRHIVEKEIQIKDPEKTIHQIDEILDSTKTLSSDLKKIKAELNRLESSLDSKKINQLDNIKGIKETYEKYLDDNVSKRRETSNNIEELDSVIIQLKKKIEEGVLKITNTNYHIQQ
jgi:conjugal transfer/entry exclusion protein